MNEKFNEVFCIESYLFDKKSRSGKTYQQLDLFEEFLGILDMPEEKIESIDSKIIQDYKIIPIKNVLK